MYRNKWDSATKQDSRKKQDRSHPDVQTCTGPQLRWRKRTQPTACYAEADWLTNEMVDAFDCPACNAHESSQRSFVTVSPHPQVGGLADKTQSVCAATEAYNISDTSCATCAETGSV